MLNLSALTLIKSERVSGLIKKYNTINQGTKQQSNHYFHKL